MAKVKQGEGSGQATLTLESLSQLADGQAKAAINAALTAAIRDTEDRGDDKKPRKVTIDVVLLKIGDDNITAVVGAKTTLPPYKTKPTFGKLKVDGRSCEMVFSPACADNPDQPRLPHTDDDDGE